MTWLVDRYKSNGQYEAAGRIAKAGRGDRSYGCHFGMRSDLEASKAAFFKAYDAYTHPTTFDVYSAHGLYEANCSKERIAEMVGVYDHDEPLAAEGYANDYVDVFPVCIMPHGAELHPEGKAHIDANGSK